MSAIWNRETFSRFAAALAQAERLPRPALETYCNSLRRRLVSFAYRESPFYRDRLQPLFRGGDEPDLRAWTEIPILSRDDLSRESERINPAALPEEMGTVSVLRTSGTTSARMSFRTCDLARLAAECMMHRLYRWHGFHLKAPLASIRYYGSGRRNYPDGITEPSWCLLESAPHYTLDLRTSIDNMIDWLSRRRPAYLLTFPSIAQDLAHHPQAGRIGELGLKDIVAISEIVSSDARDDVRRMLHCGMAQIYACAEMGCIALQSETDEQCLICEETVHVEILNRRGEPVGPGENGRVVLTSLYNYATPLIRYEIGDYATLSDLPCSAGRSLQGLQRITGRRRNALLARDGSRRWEHAVIDGPLLQEIGDHVFQIRQPDLDTIELAYIWDGAARPAPNQAAVADYFAGLLGGPVDLRITPVKEIARSTGGKRERIVSAVASCQ